MEEGKKYVVVDYLGIKNNKSKSMKQEENVDSWLYILGYFNLFS